MASRHEPKSLQRENQTDNIEENRIEVKRKVEKRRHNAHDIKIYRNIKVKNMLLCIQTQLIPMKSANDFVERNEFVWTYHCLDYTLFRIYNVNDNQWHKYKPANDTKLFVSNYSNAVI